MPNTSHTYNSTGGAGGNGLVVIRI
jgi:hypothetical protein